MRRLLQRYILSLLLLFVGFEVFGQNEGVVQPKESAIDLAFQQPEKWTGFDYRRAYTYWERSYVAVGIGTDGIWGLSGLLGGSTNGLFSTVGFGHWFAPVHGYEVGFNYGLLPALDWQMSRLGTPYYEDSYTKYLNLRFNYLFNITSYANKLEVARRWEWIALAGLDIRFQQMYAFGVNTSMRCKYNLTPEVGLYIEPRLGVFTNGLDNETATADYKLHILPSISAGLTVKLERSEGYRKSDYEEAAVRTHKYLKKHGTKRNIFERTFGRRLNPMIIADTLDKETVARLKEQERVAQAKRDSLAKVVIIPTDSAGLAELKADSIRRAVIVRDSLKQIAIMRKDPAGRALLEADSMRLLAIVQADSLANVAKLEAEAERQAAIDWEKEHKYIDGDVAVSTNLLFWALATPNIGFEFPVKDDYSVVFEYACPWFANRPSGFSYRIVNFDLEGRYWIKQDNRLRGLYAGAYASYGYYDFQSNGSGFQGKNLISGGVCGGYSIPLGRTISLELSVGVGLMHTTYSSYYDYEELLIYQSKHTFSFFGPTKAAVGITWSPNFHFKDIKKIDIFNKKDR